MKRRLLRRPVFVVGTIRSGSTLTARCLGQHPLIRYVGFELAAEWSRVGGAPIAHCETDDPNCPPLGAEHATAAIRQALHDCFAARLAEAGERPVFLSKNPHLSNKLAYLRALFPDASLVVSSRDVRSTVASIRALFPASPRGYAGCRIHLPEAPGACWSQSPPHTFAGVDPARTFPGGDVRVIAEYWLRTYEAIDAELAGFERSTLAHHRRLTAAPQEELARVVRELGIPARRFELPFAIDRGRNERWHQILSDREQDQLEGFIASERDRISALRSAEGAA
ncbi:MAG TPA: sulfotransferase [Thermoanaerobaculia bacterium]|nr:sulfotransferase [Thermoanaerobaculia bacterium]